MELVKVCSIVGIGLYGLIGSYLLFSQKGKSVPNKIIGVFFVLLALNLLDGWLMLDGFYLKHPEWAVWEDPLALLYGPAIWIISFLAAL